jgi:hypothetical protein
VNPADRPTAAQARDLLGAVAAGQDPLPYAAPEGPTATRVFAPATPVGPSTRPNLPSAQPPGGGGRRRLPLLIAAVLALLLVGGGAAAFALSRGGTGTAQAAAPTTVPAAAPTTTQAPPTTAAATTTVAPTSATPSPTPSSTAGVSDPVAFVQRYYSLLPGNPDAAFALLSPAAQSLSGGRDRFANFYAGMAAVTLQDPRQTSDHTVSARVRFVRKTGVTTNEAYSFTMSTAADGTTLMQSFSH